MIRYLKNVISGTISHWTSTNNIAVNIISNKLDNNDIESIETIRRFLACSMITVDQLLGPKRYENFLQKISGSNVKSLTIDDFVQIYTELIKMHANIYFISNNGYNGKLIKDMNKLFQYEFMPLNYNIENIESVIKEIVFNGLNKSFKHVSFLNKPDPLRDYFLFVTATSSHNQLLKK